MSAGDTICFGDVIKLYTKSAHVTAEPDAEEVAVGFLEQGKNNQLLLVVPPIKPQAKTRFLEAEFIVSPIRCDKPQANGTALTYKQSFLLRTSDGHGYALNNKVSGMKDAVNLQPMATKGEMCVCITKEGFTGETIVLDKDSGISISVVDSNRTRKTFNNPLAHFARPKSDAQGGFVGCGGTKGAVPLTFTIVKQQGKTETMKFVKNPDMRRTSQILLEAKEDEVGRADRVDSDVSDADALSRPGSMAAIASAVSDGDAQESTDTSATTTATTPATEAAPVSEPTDVGTNSTTAEEPAPASTTLTEEPVVVTPPASTTKHTDATPAESAQVGAPAAAKEEKAKMEEETKPEASVAESQISVAFTGKSTTVSPVAPAATNASSSSSTTTGPMDKLSATTSQQQQSSMTVTSEDADALTEERLQTDCVGKCVIS